MNVRFTEMSSILKHLFKITLGVIIMFVMLPFVVVWFCYLFLKFLIEDET